MASCLGLFVQENLIKFAKVSKENDRIKVENYGIKFFEQNLEKVIDQIVDETFSYKTPISINLVNEKYTTAEVFALLSDADQRKSIKTEFEYFCNEKGKNKLALEYRSVFTKNKKDEDKKEVLYSYAEKGDIAQRVQLLDKYRITNLAPTSFAIGTIQEDRNCIIVNIEDRTEVTTVIDGEITKVDIIDTGITEVLKKIAEKENSIAKAYEVCKNTTLYTADSKNLQTESNEYLDIIIPSIFKISEELRGLLEKKDINIEKIYITGTGATVNNIDLYFQENFLNYKCEILTPYFVDKTSLKLNIKDYIEVNSAIAMAIQVLNKKNKNINFVNGKQELWEQIKQALTSDVSFDGKLHGSKRSNNNKTIDLNIKTLTVARFAYSMLIILIIYIIITTIIQIKIKNKTEEAEEVKQDIITKTAEINDYTKLIDARTKTYESVLEQLEEANERTQEKYSSKNAIPNLLSEVMFAIPKEAQILSINNTTDKHVVIQAQSEEYQYLGYFKSELQNRAILVNVISTSGKRVDNMIQVTIEGDLPY